MDDCMKNDENRRYSVFFATVKGGYLALPEALRQCMRGSKYVFSKGFYGSIHLYTSREYDRKSNAFVEMVEKSYGDRITNPDARRAERLLGRNAVDAIMNKKGSYEIFRVYEYFNLVTPSTLVLFVTFNVTGEVESILMQDPLRFDTEKQWLFISKFPAINGCKSFQ